MTNMIILKIVKRHWINWPCEFLKLWLVINVKREQVVNQNEECMPLLIHGLA